MDSRNDSRRFTLFSSLMHWLCQYSIDWQIAGTSNYANSAKPVIRVTNTGRRPITVKSIELKIKNQRLIFYWEHVNLPHLLQPSEFVIEPLNFDFGKRHPKQVTIIDSTGRRWHASRKQLLNLVDKPIAQAPEKISAVQENEERLAS